ncbi:hypothetical protein LZ31DRAFT_279419 [Colletotrichum somersetense]|nr:hypothetical protein LZ31DRAFT_279419 [Colletotrichum somersetense]
MAKDALPISVAMFLNMGSPRRDGSGSCETLPKTQDSRCTGQRPGKTQTHTHIPNSHAHVMAVERKMQARVVFYFYSLLFYYYFSVLQPFGCACGRRREPLADLPKGPAYIRQRTLAMLGLKKEAEHLRKTENHKAGQQGCHPIRSGPNLTLPDLPSLLQYLCRSEASSSGRISSPLSKHIHIHTSSGEGKYAFQPILLQLSLCFEVVLSARMKAES